MRQVVTPEDPVPQAQVDTSSLVAGTPCGTRSGRIRGLVGMEKPARLLSTADHPRAAETGADAVLEFVSEIYNCTPQYVRNFGWNNLHWSLRYSRACAKSIIAYSQPT